MDWAKYVRDYDYLPPPARRSAGMRTEDILRGVIGSLTAARWTTRTLNDEEGRSWRGCLLGHFSRVILNDQGSMVAAQMVRYAHADPEFGQAIEIVARCIFRRQYKVELEGYYRWNQREAGNLDWSPETQAGFIASFNDSCDYVEQVREAVEEALQQHLRPHYDAWSDQAPQEHVVDRILREKEEVAAMFTVSPIVFENGEYPPLHVVNEEETIEITGPTGDLDAEFAELLSKEPVAA